MTKSLFVLFLIVLSQFTICKESPESVFPLGLSLNPSNLLTIKISLGTPPQSFSFLVSTTTSSLYLFSNSCTLPFCKFLTQFSPSSSTLQDLHTNTTFLSHPFFDCFLDASVYKDISNSVRQTAHSPALMAEVLFMLISDTEGACAKLALKVSEHFSMGFDGVVGVAYPQEELMMARGWIENVIDQNVLLGNGFSLYFGDKEGEFVVGDVLQMVEHELKYYDMVPGFGWSVQVDNVYLGDDEICDSKVIGIIDTETAYIEAHEDVIGHITNNLMVDPQCMNLDQLPDITFNIAGDFYTFSPKDYVWKSTEEDQEVCRMGIRAANHPEYLIKFGTIFLKKYYTHFNLRNRNIGFAEASRVKLDIFE
jgi:hypothetical protein